MPSACLGFLKGWLWRAGARHSTPLELISLVTFLFSDKKVTHIVLRNTAINTNLKDKKDVPGGTSFYFSQPTPGSSSKEFRTAFCWARISRMLL